MYQYLSDIADPFTQVVTFQEASDIISVTAEVQCGNAIVGSVNTIDFHITTGDNVSVTCYGIQSLIAYWMKANDLTVADFTIVYSGDNGSGIDAQSVDLSILYTRFKVQGQTAAAVIANQFLNTQPTFVVPDGQSIRIARYFPSGRTTLKVREYFERDGGIDWTEFNLPVVMPSAGISILTINPSEYVHEGDKVYYWEIRYPNNTNVITIYHMREAYYHKVSYRNRFNLMEDVYVPCSVRTEHTKEYESGTINGKLIPYDIERTITHTLQADALTPQLLHQLREACISDKVFINGEEVIITEHDLPSTDALNEPIAFSLSYQSATINGIDTL